MHVRKLHFDRLLTITKLNFCQQNCISRNAIRNIHLFQEISLEGDIKYHIDDDFVYIYTKHFTKFIVTNTDTVQEITDALFTVAASYEQTDVKSIIQLRLMLHSDCASLKDFSFQRRKVGGINC